MARQRTMLGWMLAALMILSVGQLFSLTEHARQSTARAAIWAGRSFQVRGVVIRQEIPVTADPSVSWVPGIRDGQRVSAGQILLREETGPEEAERAFRLRVRQRWAEAAAMPVTSRRAAIRAAVARGAAGESASKIEAAEILIGLVLAEGGAPGPAEAETVPQRRTVTSPGSGVFAAAADGLETLLTPEDPWYVWSLPLGPPSPETVGRLITGDTWYFRARLPFSAAPEERLTGFLPWCGDTLTLRVEEVRNGMTLLSCEQLLAEVANVRQVEMKILENCKTGLEIPADGVYTVEGKSGVWRMEGEAARFVPVTVLRRLEDTVVVDMDPAQGPLWPGDEILLDGQ